MPAKVKDVIGSVSVEQDPAKRAAALAAEALRLAEEARRANARVAEVRKSLSLKSPAQSPAVTPRAYKLPEDPVLDEQRDAKLTKRLSFDPPDGKISSFNFDPPQGTITKVQEPEEERHTNPPTPPRTTPVEEKLSPVDIYTSDDVVAARSDVSGVQPSQKSPPPITYHAPPSPPAAVPAPVEPVQRVHQEPSQPSPPSPPSTYQAPIVMTATPTPPVSPVIDTLAGTHSNSMTAQVVQPANVQQQKAMPPNKAAVTMEEEEEKSSNLFVRVLDAIGVDTFCGVDEAALKKEREEYEKKRARQLAKEEKEAVLERERYWASKSVSGDTIGPKIVPPPTMTRNPTAPVTQAPAPVVRAPTPPPVIQAPTPPVVAPVAATSTTVPVMAEESQPVQEAPAVTTTPMASPPVQPAAPSPLVDEAEVPHSKSAESTVRSAIHLKRHTDPTSTKRTQKENLIHPVMAYPDPFGGEHEDFMPCACFNDPAIIVDENEVPYDQAYDQAYDKQAQPEPEAQQHQVQQQQIHHDPLDDPHCLC